jgi:hypothetical protein
MLDERQYRKYEIKTVDDTWPYPAAVAWAEENIFKGDYDALLRACAELPSH